MPLNAKPRGSHAGRQLRRRHDTYVTMQPFAAERPLPHRPDEPIPKRRRKRRRHDHPTTRPENTMNLLQHAGRSMAVLQKLQARYRTKRPSRKWQVVGIHAAGEVSAHRTIHNRPDTASHIQNVGATNAQFPYPCPNVSSPIGQTPCRKRVIVGVVAALVRKRKGELHATPTLNHARRFIRRAPFQASKDRSP